MNKASKLIAARLKGVDIVVEVRDARVRLLPSLMVPLLFNGFALSLSLRSPSDSRPHQRRASSQVPISSHNTTLEPLLATAQRLVVFNKADLANPNMQQCLKQQCAQAGLRALFTVANKPSSVRKVVQAVKEQAAEASSFKVAGSTMMVVGMPNVGKSSLINALREVAMRGSASAGRERRRRRPRGKGAKQGPTPGLTRQMASLMVCESPRLYLIDTPGVMTPRVSNMDVGLRLAVTGALRDATVPDTVLADYLLYSFNRMGSRQYVEALGLPGPTDDIQEVLSTVAGRLHARGVAGGVNADVVAKHIVHLFRTGKLGRYTLDKL